MSGDARAADGRRDGEGPVGVDLDVVGIGSMVVDRMHRTPRILGGDAKGMLHDASPGRLVERHVGGVVLNHIGWAAALGLRCGLFGRQGDDDAGRFLRAAMDRAGIEHDLLLTDEPSSLAEIFVDDGGSRAIYMARGATAATTADQIRERHLAFIARARWLTTEVSQLPLAAALAALEAANEAGASTLVDLDVAPSDAVGTLGSAEELDAVLAAARILKPSKSAAAELAAGAHSSALELARALRARFGNEAVVITDGERGCAISASDFEGEIAASAAHVVDTTGAGDAFLGGLLTALCCGFDWPAAGALGNAAGAACTEQLGAFPGDGETARASVLARYEGPKLPVSANELRAPGAARESATRGAERESAAAFAVLDAARDGLVALRARARSEDFERAALLIAEARAAGGRVHTLGVGKPAHVASYAVALFSSTGTPAGVLDALEVRHGSAGQVERGDVVIAISHSGETAELMAAVDVLQDRGVRLIAVVGEADSLLGRAADCVLDAAVAREGGPLELAPRASTAAQVAVVAALAAELQERWGQTRADYARLHPAGALGRKARGSAGPGPGSGPS